MTLDPYRPIPWEAFVLIPTPRARARAITLRMFAVLGVLALVTGALWGLNQ